MSQRQIYNCMDAIATFQLWQVFKELLAEHPWAMDAYRERKALQAPALYMMLRGFLVDKDAIQTLREKFIAECKQLEAGLDQVTLPLKMGRINLAAPAQVAWMLECLGARLPRSTNYKNKSEKSADRSVLEKLAQTDIELAPVCNTVLAWRDRAKMLGDLVPSLFDKDGRVRSFYKVAGTETDRWSSARNPWSNHKKKKPSGLNMQNRKRDEDEEKSGHASIRTMFIADPGYKLAAVDLERADSWGVGLEIFRATGDKKYLHAVESSDLHTYVARLVWPNLGWTGDDEHDTKLAKQYYYRQFDYRFMCKKGGHGTNYVGSPWALATQMKIELRIAEDFQRKYLRAFPHIRPWQACRQRELQTTGYLVNLMGRRRNFHGRLDSNETLKEAIAWCGQSVTARTINRALLRLWACQVQMPQYGIELLAQVHDEIVFQFPEDQEAEVLDLVRHVMPQPIKVTSPQGETITKSIPIDIATGWNWAKRQKGKGNWIANPDGLDKPMLQRVRQKVPPKLELSRLARRLSNAH